MSDKTNFIPEFSGPFAEILPEYISFKRAQGYKFHPPIVYRLREMDLFFREMGIQKIAITREMYEAWTTPRSHQKETNAQKRRSALTSFAKYLVTNGYDDIYTGHDDGRIFKRDFIPYIFSNDEITRMFQVLSTELFSNPSYENAAFLIIIQMYYCCGFRKSEVLKLRVRDVSTDTGKVTVLYGKNDVSRIIIVSTSMLSCIQDYSRKYLDSASPDDFFVHGSKGGAYSEQTLYSKFRKLLDDSGIQIRPDGERQRIHDLRHTFCVRTLEQMADKGFDLYTSLPLLTVYLGHKHITETEYYLRMVDEHFGSVLDKTSAYSPDLFPKMVEGGVEK